LSDELPALIVQIFMVPLWRRFEGVTR
jgi:hypothetical protein